MKWLFWKHDPADWVLAQQRRREKQEASPARKIWMSNILILLVLWFLGVAVLGFGGAAFDDNLAVGQIAPKTVVTAIEFQCKDLALTELNRQRAAEKAPPVFRYLPSARNNAWLTLDKLTEQAVKVRAAQPAPLPAPFPPPVAAPAAPEEAAPEAAPATATLSPAPGAAAPPAPRPASKKRSAGKQPAEVPQLLPPVPAEPPAASPAEPAAAAPEPPALPADAPAVIQALQDIANLRNLDLSGDDLALLFPAGRERESATFLKTALEDILGRGILASTELNFIGPRLAAAGCLDIAYADATGGPTVRRVAAADLLREEDAADRFSDAIAPFLAGRGLPDPAAVAHALAADLLHPSLRYDPAASQNAQNEAAAAVPDVVMDVPVRTTILEEGIPVTAQNIEQLAAYNRRLAATERPIDRNLRSTGNYLMMLVVLIACVGWLRSVQPGVYAKSSRKWLLVLLAVVSLGVELLYHKLSVDYGYLPTWILPFAIPVTFTPMLAVLMLGPEAGLATGLWVSLSTALIFGRSFDFLFVGLAATVTAVMLLRANIRRRARLMHAGILVGFVKILVAVVLALLHRYHGETFRADIIASFASGIASAVLASVVLPLLEWAFGRTTDISLLELTDMTHPLLQRLALEAPGTYHHSRMVAIIGQAAADRIGANGLLVSVCAYFHDVGKLAKPEFFTENQRGGGNPHDSLAPSMSALLIQSHVKEGLTLAKRYRLPRIVCDGIRTHHGKSRISYFYQVARNNLKSSGLPEDPSLEASFRYEGPLPWTREQAILSLADTVEAASRSLEKITPSRISEMVDRLVRDKLLDGQLDAAPLTLAELDAVRDSFVFTLTNLLHGRSAYPAATPPDPAPVPSPAPASPAPAAGP